MKHIDVHREEKSERKIFNGRLCWDKIVVRTCKYQNFIFLFLVFFCIIIFKVLLRIKPAKVPQLRRINDDAALHHMNFNELCPC